MTTNRSETALEAYLRRLADQIKDNDAEWDGFYTALQKAAQSLKKNPNAFLVDALLNLKKAVEQGMMQCDEKTTALMIKMLQIISFVDTEADKITPFMRCICELYFQDRKKVNLQSHAQENSAHCIKEYFDQASEKYVNHLIKLWHRRESFQSTTDDFDVNKVFACVLLRKYTNTGQYQVSLAESVNDQDLRVLVTNYRGGSNYSIEIINQLLGKKLLVQAENQSKKVDRKVVSATLFSNNGTYKSAITERNPVLNFMICDMRPHALTRVEKGLPKGPFTGVPFPIKDIAMDYAGFPSALGSKLLKDNIQTTTSELVKRYEKAGLVIVGKTNIPEFAAMGTTEPAAFGATLNPWDTTRTAGGSSGGSASAVAARIVPFAHGNDAAGSLRIPASCCGVFTLKPTRGLMPSYFAGRTFQGMNSDHILSLSVRDSAAMLDATAGAQPTDAFSANLPQTSFLESLQQKPESLRIAVITDPFYDVPVHADCLEAVNQAGKIAHPQIHPLSRERNSNKKMNQFAGEGWGEGTRPIFNKTTQLKHFQTIPNPNKPNF